MAKNVIINGNTYASVPYVDMPRSDSEQDARFVDTDSGDLEQSDIRAGKKGWAQGQEVVGTQPTRHASDVTVSGKTVTAPAGIYDDAVSKSVADGSVSPTATVSGDEIGTNQTDYEITVTPAATVGSGYVSGDKTGATITKYIQVEDKTVSPSTSAQDVTPRAGKLLKKVHVNPVEISGTATPDVVLAGYTFQAGGSLELKTGEASVPTVSQDSQTHGLYIQ